MFFLKSIMQDDATLGKIDWNSIINQAFGVGSQAISAFSGQNTGTQIGYNSSQGVFAINPGGSIPNSQRFDETNLQTQLALAAAQRQGGLGFDAAAGGIMSYISNNPLLVGGIALGAYLLFREPPKRR